MRRQTGALCTAPLLLQEPQAATHLGIAAIPRDAVSKERDDVIGLDNPRGGKGPNLAGVWLGVAEFARRVACTSTTGQVGCTEEKNGERSYSLTHPVMVTSWAKVASKHADTRASIHPSLSSTLPTYQSSCPLPHAHVHYRQHSALHPGHSEYGWGVE